MAEIRRMEIEPAENGGHTITHMFKSGPSSPSKGMDSYAEPETHVFGASEGKKMMAHISDTLGMSKPAKGMTPEMAEAVRVKMKGK